MKLDSRIRKTLLRRAKSPRAVALWSAYIAFLERCPTLPDYAPKTSVHHILWRAEFPKFRTCRWNWIRLRHEDHTAASALMLGAEPNNPRLFAGFDACSKMGIDGPVNLWRPTKSVERRIIRLYLRERQSPRTIARRFGTSAPVVRAFLKRIGIKLRSLSESHRWPLSESSEKEVIRLYLGGEGVVRIGAKFGVGWRTVRKFLRLSNVKLRTRSERNAMWRSLERAA